MKRLSKLFLAATAISMGAGTIYGNLPEGKTFFQQEIEENNDEDELLKFITAKRSIPLADKSKNLSISGEVHAEWNYQTEKLRGRDIRVFEFREEEEWDDEIFLPGDTIAVGPNDYDVQWDFFVDWKTDNVWARTHLRYDNSFGCVDNGIDKRIDPQGYHGSGTVDNLALKEAYIGYEVFKKDDHRLTLELGRRGNIYKALYSEIQFSSRLDGFILKYTGKLGKFVEEWYLTGIGFVVDERATHYAWAVELGLDNVLNSGIDFKYSFIDWHKRGRNRYFIKNPLGFRFKVSQFSLLYDFNPKWLCDHPIELAMGFLINHTPARFTFIDETPDRVVYTRKEKHIGTQNLGGFVEIQYRSLEREGDWYINALIGFCQAQCIPDNDVRNIGTGNFLHESMTSDGRGNTNWKGYCFKVGYALTDNWVLESQYVHSWSIKSIAGSQGYTRYTMESIYSF